MPVAVQLASLACALGSVVFATVGASSTRGLLAGVLAFAGTLAWPPAALVPASTGGAGLVVAALAVGRLAGWTRQDLLALTAGWLAATWAALLRLEGVPLWAAVLVALALPCISAARARSDQAFAPTRLLEDALVVVAVVAAGAAAAPGLIEGWQAAVNLNLAGAPTEQSVMVPAWSVAVSLAAIAAGAGFGAWSRR